MPRVRTELREQTLGFWRGHSEAWKASGLTQKEYCEQQGISLKNFGNWRAQLKRIEIAGPEARWGHYPRLRPRSGPRASPRTTERPEDIIPPRGGRREFSDDFKQRIVAETCKPGASVSAVAKKYRITTSLLFRWRAALGAEPLPQRATFLPVRVVGDPMPVSTEMLPAPAMAPPVIVERAAPGIEVELIGGRRVRFDRGTDAETVKQVVAMLEGAGP